ncbi:hypothetical protein ACQ1Q1_00035 [Ornithobacterium rhinotracheale]|uniref:Uncharacterized protein n=1 Tax=Ornithobacterium rhinotracheale (strain ATCC 51463 / DSM 15997 / CCUG 23171 / CIP 104009 / LMG 9086) TaxID=867902 RepID=I3ZY00_ORNRL|nr:hypothetical protein [Ornithobacterium rhinotracheale]AFL96584.1 hypothetical protein Ornrh_0376 [Ornithobacterium rhinotracheale DSM 15997]AIQ00314.1 hypothetical protein Q785_02010 [Ornithobacterium rhinotracheale ORT-UMN 88]KGB67886.1 hypothetical protein Q787_01980 [Ornithobacterium rhinotracheale H06-030791]MBN3663153.1 hypothetical protein [Ornithobacterium rhinotracheale]MCK0194909.1 hypothetical protein [Ornithobacterium rhinotracheale]
MTKLKESLTDEQTALIEKLTREISVNPTTQNPEYNIRITGDYIDRLGLVADIVEVSRVALLNDTYEPAQIVPSVANVLQVVNELIPYEGAELLNNLKGI